MGYRRKWTPSAAQRKEFAINMQDEDFRNDYEARKAERAANKRATSKFDYATAGGMYVPTKNQHDFVMNYSENLTAKQQDAFDQITYGYSCKEKVHHDHIHIVNEMIRNAG